MMSGRGWLSRRTRKEIQTLPLNSYRTSSSKTNSNPGSRPARPRCWMGCWRGRPDSRLCSGWSPTSSHSNGIEDNHFYCHNHHEPCDNPHEPHHNHHELCHNHYEPKNLVTLNWKKVDFMVIFITNLVTLKCYEGQSLLLYVIIYSIQYREFLTCTFTNKLNGNYFIFVRLYHLPEFEQISA